MKIRMEQLFDLTYLCLWLVHQLEEEAEGHLEALIALKLGKVLGIDVFCLGVDITVLIEEVAQVLEELYGELEVLKEFKTCTDGIAVLQLVLCVVDGLVCAVLYEVTLSEGSDLNAGERLCKYERTEGYEVQSPLYADSQFCETILGLEFFLLIGHVFTVAGAFYQAAEFCTLNLIEEFRLDCEAKREGELKGNTKVIVLDAFDVLCEVFCVDFSSGVGETGYDTDLSIGNHYGSKCNCDDSKKFHHDRLDI